MSNSFTTVKTANSSFRDKKADPLLKIEYPNVLKALNIETIGLTGVHIPEDIEISKAWKKTVDTIPIILKDFQNIEEVAFLILAIEIHPEKKKKKKKTEKLTLEGYPHIHIAIGHVNLKGDYPDKNIYGKLLMKYYPDVVVGSTKGRGKFVNKDDPIALTRYVFKNSRHRPVYELLENTNPIFVFNLKGGDTIDNFFASLNKKLPFNYNSYSTKSTQIDVKSTSINEKKMTAKKEETSLDKAINWVKAVMEHNNFRLFEGNLYKKNPKSRMTWTKINGNIDSFLGNLMDIKHVNLIVKFYKQLKDIMEKKYQGIFPVISIDYQWVEYNDFFLHIGTGTIFLNQEKYPCFKFYPEITIEKWEYSDEISPTCWLYLLNNLEIMNHKDRENPYDNFIKLLYGLLLPRSEKNEVLSISGPPNSGKTTLIEAVAKILPIEKITTIARAGNFSMSNLMGKFIVIMDEKNGANIFKDGEFLKLLEGDSHMSINKKYKTPTMEYINFNSVIMSNDSLIENHLDESDPLLARIQSFKMDRIKKPDPKGKEKVFKERPLILLWLATNYFQIKENRSLFLCESLCNDEDEIIKEWMDNYKEWFPKTSNVDLSFSIPN